jgi:outer membrane lipoprotein-sorting protein
MKKGFQNIQVGIIFFLVVMSSFFFSAIPSDKKDPSGMQIVREMFAKSKLITGMTYTMKKQERIEGKLQQQVSDTKLSLNPLKVYLRQKSPKDGLEVLYVTGKNNNHALINTNGFPWVNISLDPMGNTMRENQHHTLYESGYSHLISILEHLTNKYGKEAESMITNTGTVTWNGKTCYVIAFNNPNFKYIQHTIKAGETILTISEKSKLSEYMILELNKDKVDSYTDVSVGQVITIPNDYSSKMELYIDKQSMLPSIIKVYDDKGLYEYYEYNNVVINPVFKSNEFDKSFPDYNF